MTNTIFTKLAITIVGTFVSLVAIEANPAQAENLSAQENPSTAHTAHAEQPSSQESPGLTVAQGQNIGAYRIQSCTQVAAKGNTLGLPSGLEVGARLINAPVGQSGLIPLQLPQNFSFYLTGGGGIQQQVRVCRQQLLQ